VLDVTPRGPVSLITLRRPDQHNALDLELCGQLQAAVETAAQTARVIVITGEGRSFCAGADFASVSGAEFRGALYGALGAITAAPVPVIAAINGPAIGAGTQLAIACDLRVGGERARFALPTAKLGLAVDPWTIRRLALLVGGAPSRLLLLGDGQLDADRAHQLGFLDRRGDLDVALEWAEQLAALAPLTLAYNKRALEELMEPARPDSELEQRFEGCWDSADFLEGLAARAEGRPPRFEGR
jgi:enoyl-CoA hydratase